MKERSTKSSGRGALRVKVKSAKGREVSSTRWLARQLNDPYVREAREKGYRSRAAFKLIELDQKFHFLKKGAVVLDLGAAPGGWSQVAAARAGEMGRVVAADILETEPIAHDDGPAARVLTHDGGPIVDRPAQTASRRERPSDVVPPDLGIDEDTVEIEDDGLERR